MTSFIRSAIPFKAHSSFPFVYIFKHNLKEIVTDMAIVRKLLGKHISEVTLSTAEGHPLPGNGSLNMFAQQRISTQ
jgi:hypothetical protein